MERRIIVDMIPDADNARNSEGAFLRLDSGRILFAFSRFGNDFGDNAGSNIFCIYSDDEGESWQDLGYIATAAEFGLTNIMSVSSMRLSDGKYAFFFLIKEGTDRNFDSCTSIGVCYSEDGESFKTVRCNCEFPKGWYGINNDRFIRLSDGRIAAPMVCSKHPEIVDGEEKLVDNPPFINIIVSSDEGKTFTIANKEKIMLPEKLAINGAQIEEPGLLETEPGKFILWGRSNLGSQLVARSENGFDGFSTLAPSEFISPQSPMSMYKDGDTIYAVHNPNPCPLYPYGSLYIFGRTEAVIRKSLDGGKTFGEYNYFETDLDRGFCYFAMFKTKDDSMLLGYCAGSNDDGYCLNRLRISKIKLGDIK